MRSTRLLAVVMSMSIGWSLAAQTPSPPMPPAQPPAASDPRLDELLLRWEKETIHLQTMVAEITCTRKHGTFDSTRVLSGTAKFYRPDLARIDLEEKGTGVIESYICTGSHVYHVNSGAKLIHVFPLTHAAGQLPDEGPMPFIFGMKAENAKKRYDMRIVAPKNKEHEKWYTYVEVRPRFGKDLNDFTWARLVILKSNNLPCQLLYFEPNKTQITFDITKIQRDVPNLVKRTDFEKPSLPKGWEWRTESAQTAKPTGSPPKVIRPQGNK